MTYGTINKHGNIRCTSTDIDDADTEFFLVLFQYRVAGSHLFQYDSINNQSTALDTFGDVLSGTDSPGNQMHFGFQPYS